MNALTGEPGADNERHVDFETRVVGRMAGVIDANRKYLNERVKEAPPLENMKSVMRTIIGRCEDDMKEIGKIMTTELSKLLTRPGSFNEKDKKEAWLREYHGHITEAIARNLIAAMKKLSYE